MLVKRILPMLLSVVITASMLLASCGDSATPNKNNDDNSDNTTVATDSDNTNTDVDVQPEEFEAKDINYNGYKFRMIGYDQYQGSWKAVSYSEIFTEEENGDPINDAVYKRNRTVEELYNIEIALTPGVSYSDRGSHANTVLRSILAGDDNFDAGLIIGNQMPKILTTPNALVELKSMPGIDLERSWWDQKSIKELSIANSLYTITGDMSLYGAFGTVVVYANKDMIQEYALDNPYQLVKDGTWTWDKLYEMCKSIVRDLDGDGVITYKDQIGIMSESGSLLFALLSGSQRLSLKDSDDMPVLAINNERTMTGIDTVVGVLRDKGTNMNTGDVSGYGNAFFEFTMPKFRDGNALFFTHQLFSALNLREMEADFAILPMPKLDAGQDGYNSVSADMWLTYLFVPTTNQDHERTGVILDAMGFYSQKYLMPAFYDVTVTSKVARDEDSVEMLDLILQNRVYDLANLYNWGAIGTIFSDIYSRANNTFASIYEKKEAAIINAMNKTLDEIIE